MAHTSSMPALPLPPNRPATTAPAQAPLSTGAPALPPPAQHTRYPPPPPVVAAPNTDASSANRDNIMQARLDLFPLCLYGAELLSVTKGLATTFYEQRPISINVVLDPQMGVRLYGEGDARSIDLFYSRPAFCSNDKQFILRNGHDNRFFMLTLAPDTPDDVVGHMETILMCFCTMYKKVFTEEELKEIALHEDADLTSSKAARGIESGGAAVGKGMVKGAGWMGSGMRGMAGFVKDHTDSGHREVTEEERKKVESRAKTAVKFRKGVSMVSGAVAKGANMAGTGVAKAGHWSVEQYKETDYYKEKQVGKEDEGPTKGDKAINVAKSSGAAIGNVWSGLVISTKIVASDVRESTADVVEHRRGKEHAELTRTQFNMAADVTVGGFKTFDLVSMYYKLVPKLALKVGAGALTYDPYKQDALHGIGWKEGWLKFEGNVREPWKPYYAVLKTYSFAWYKDELQEDLAGYIPCREILEMKPISELQTKYKHSLQIVSKGEHQIVSLHCEGHPGWIGGTDAEMTQRGEEWMDAVMSLAFVQQKYRR